MDNLTKEQRRKNMQRIRAKDTGIELRLRKALWHKGYRYRKNDKNLPGKPDIVLTKYKIAIFCDSEFFHGKDWEVLKPRIEKGTNSDYWLKKISNNRRRDDEVNKQLLFRGWTVIRFWGKDIQKNLDECVNVVEEAIFDSKMDEAADLEGININMDTMAQINSFFYERLLFNKKQIAEHVPEAEVWDLYNENRELLGKEHIRGEQMPIDGYHLVVHVWIRNSKGEYLISQRSANRPTYPLMWECVGGSVVKGEDSLQGAIREAKEEVGVDLEPGKGQVLFSKTRRITDGKIYNDIVDVWLFDYDGEVDLGKATTDEVAQVTWMKREQIKELFEQNVFVDTQEYFFTEVDRQ